APAQAGAQYLPETGTLGPCLRRGTTTCPHPHPRLPRARDRFAPPAAPVRQAVARSAPQAHRGGHERGQRRGPRPHAVGGRAHPRARRPPDRGRGQADAADADLRRGRAVRLPRHPPPQARRRSGVHPYRHPAPRRCGGRQRHPAGQAHRQPHLGQSGERAGRRFPLLALVRADGRGRVLEGAPHPQPRLRGDRGGRGRPAHRPAPDRHGRGQVSPHHQRQDRCPVRRRLPHRAGGGGSRRGGGAGAGGLWPQPRHRLPAGGRRDRLHQLGRDQRQGPGRRLPRRQDDPADHPRLRPRQRGGPALLAGGDLRRAGERRRPRPRRPSAAEHGSDQRHAGASTPVCATGTGRAGALSVEQGESGADGGRRVRSGSGVL
ncbi:MAG: Decaprenyl diphosphate synthase, partial [uncultured Sphingomonas sp.]